MESKERDVYRTTPDPSVKAPEFVRVEGLPSVEPYFVVVVVFAAVLVGAFLAFQP